MTTNDSYSNSRPQQSTNLITYSTSNNSNNTVKIMHLSRTEVLKHKT